MKGLKGALMFAQSGGPTSVINASAAGVFIEGLILWITVTDYDFFILKLSEYFIKQ